SSFFIKGVPKTAYPFQIRSEVVKERWIDVKDYEGLYQVSNLGRVKGTERVVKNGKNSVMIKPEVILKPINNGNGYHYVNLLKDGVQRKTFIHRIVALSFLPNNKDYPVVNHKDENKLNNNVENLEWCTQSYNSNYRGASKRRALATDYTALGNRRKKELMQYDLDGNFIRRWDSATDCAKATGYHNSGIYACCNGKLDKYKGYKWKYVNEVLI